MIRALIAPLVLCGGLLAQQDDPGKLAPYYPTPAFVVQKMLALGQLKPGEKMFDLGSGDGRIVIMAAKEFKARAVGVEIDPDLLKQSRSRLERMGLTETASITQGDILTQDYSSADLVTVYLLPTSNDKVRPILEQQLKKGARVVCHDFDMSGWTPEREEHIEDDGEGRSHTLYLYRR
jgi:ubiquinone/menaquinone biosynthesis C-methylase UbiE